MGPDGCTTTRAADPDRAGGARCLLPRASHRAIVVGLVPGHPSRRPHRMRTGPLALALVLLAPLAAVRQAGAITGGPPEAAVPSAVDQQRRRAQERWQEIGRTNIGNPVLLDGRSVERQGAMVRATLRVAFVKPVKSPRGDITSSRTTLRLDCAARRVAILENVFYHDERANRIYDRRVVAQPGFAPPLGGSMPEVAMTHLCAS